MERARSLLRKPACREHPETGRATRHYVGELVLREQLKDLHLLVDLHVAVLAPHASVEKLIEVHVPVVALNCHLQHLLLELGWLVVVLAEAKRRVLVAVLSEHPEELWQLLLLDLEAIVFGLGLRLPHAHETVKISFEPHNHVILGQIVFLELLDDNENEQIQHHVGAHYHEDHEVHEAGPAAARLALDAPVLLLPTAIKHNFVPILASGHSEEQDEGRGEVSKVL